MADIACVRVVWDREQFWPLPIIRHTDGHMNHAIKFSPVHFGPETGYPAGRKGAAIAGAWKQLGTTAAGMLILDADVAIDPMMVITMMRAIGDDPESVWTAPVRIWPVSTMKDSWVWAHWETEPSQRIDDVANWFSFNFTYVPRALVEHCLKGNQLQSWTYPRVDASMARAARQMGIKGRVVQDCFPIHLHW
ncbi:MAG: hypothetical protein WAM97_04755 [Acidimicrobiales bacterium]